MKKAPQESILQKCFNENVRPLAQEMLELDWSNTDVYAQWLAQTYYFVLNSTRLIAFNGSMFPLHQTSFHSRFISHAKEELNHDRLATTDLKKIGRDISKISEAPVTAAFWQSQMYWTLCKGPMSFYGYIFCLEGLAVTMGPELYEKLKGIYGDSACGFIRVHAGEDVDHLQQAFDLVADVSEKEMELICENMRQCCGMYRAILRHAAETGATLKSASRQANGPKATAA